MVHEAARRRRGDPVFELTPAVAVPVDPRLRWWVAGDYAGHDTSSLPGGDYVDAATLVTQLAVKVADQPWHPPALVNGPNGTYTRVHGPWTGALATRLSPLGAYKVFGPVLGELAGSYLLALEDVVGADARRLSEQVLAARTWRERGRRLDAFLLDRARRGPDPAPEVAQAWHLLVRSGGRSTIGGLARQVGWSHKHLITKFKQQVGVAPNTAARLLRFATVWRHLDRDDRGQTWARVAAESGYADQAHLIREVRHFTGTTPTALVTGRPRDAHDEAGDRRDR